MFQKQEKCFKSRPQNIAGPYPPPTWRYLQVVVKIDKKKNNK